MKLKLVYTDLDGTLLGRGGSLLHDADGRPSLAAAQALVAAAEAGLGVVAVSGRRAAQLAQDARLLGLAGAIAELGAVVIREGTTHQRWGACPRGAWDTPRQALESVGALEVLHRVFPDAVEPYLPWDEGRTGGVLLHGALDVALANAALVEAGIPWAQVVDNGPSSGARSYHLLPVGIGKASAVAEDLRERGVDPAEAMAIGDSPEDATMATAVGRYVEVSAARGFAAAITEALAGQA